MMRFYEKYGLYKNTALLRNSLSSNEKKYEPVVALINRRLSLTPNTKGP